MATFLFNNVIFGPVWSRRLGESLGINLLPTGIKVCNFNCIYCECGRTPSETEQSRFPTVEEVSALLSEKLSELKSNSSYLNSITFAGNGEPTLHPEFDRMVDTVLEIRDRIVPGVSVAVLSNATRIENEGIFNSLFKVDFNILKLDSAIDETLRNINCPTGKYDLDAILDSLQRFHGKLIIQTLFLKGFCNGRYIDNTSEKEVNAWVSAIEMIRPQSVMIYSLARDTAIGDLEQVGEHDLNRIAALLEEKGISTQVTP